MATVKTHKRRTSSGKTTTVRKHSRREGFFKPKRAGRNLKRAWKYARRHKKAAAFAFTTLAVGELSGFLAGRALMTTALVLCVAAVLVFKAAGHHDNASPHVNANTAPARITVNEKHQSPYKSTNIPGMSRRDEKIFKYWERE